MVMGTGEQDGVPAPSSPTMAPSSEGQGGPSPTLPGVPSCRARATGPASVYPNVLPVARQRSVLVTSSSNWTSWISCSYSSRWAISCSSNNSSRELVFLLLPTSYC